MASVTAPSVTGIAAGGAASFACWCVVDCFGTLCMCGVLGSGAGILGRINAAAWRHHLNFNETWDRPIAEDRWQLVKHSSTTSSSKTALGDRLTYEKMFGEYTLYVDGKIVALACDDSLLVKPSAAAAEIAPGLAERAPSPGAKLCLVADELLDDAELISRRMLKTAALMPMPKPKKASGTSRKTTK